jgi:hypothetical protein
MLLILGLGYLMALVAATTLMREVSLSIGVWLLLEGL